MDFFVWFLAAVGVVACSLVAIAAVVVLMGLYLAMREANDEEWHLSIGQGYLRRRLLVVAPLFEEDPSTINLIRGLAENADAYSLRDEWRRTRRWEADPNVGSARFVALADEGNP